MLEAWVIIIMLGGLEYVLWRVERKRSRREAEADAKLQRSQMAVLDGILTELVIRNQTDEESQSKKRS
jgi:hypothetical protein